ncbi:recombinase family protein [Chryseobacterium sp. HSC-36S06]|uniref:recombinase family protein n=1 Tax=Chryseobacterium sp. HSC-36S06 TaxID=2910970 RepID=UPI0020A16BD8|nr:recombinase family protein [Chryseobacterium sp. HSC-36S06]MCP2036933.1 DNA invertase Pin-like site-specific DNA recombinase [Chryseobacterium sp. HSC-36S06]
MKARYVRVSTANQNVARQLAKSYPDEKIYVDVISGAVPFGERPMGKQLLEDIENETIKYLTVENVDRLGRNVINILSTISFLTERKICLKVSDLGLESLVNGKPNAAFKLIVSVIANLAEMSRNNILTTQRQGIAIAKAQNKYKGRMKNSFESDDSFFRKHNEVVKNLKKGTSIRDVAKICKVSPSTVQKVKNRMK